MCKKYIFYIFKCETFFKYFCLKGSYFRMIMLCPYLPPTQLFSCVVTLSHSLLFETTGGYFNRSLFSDKTSPKECIATITRAEVDRVAAKRSQEISSTEIPQRLEKKVKTVIIQNKWQLYMMDA